MRHFLSVSDLTADEFRAIIKRGSEFRQQFEAGVTQTLFPRTSLAMIFAKSSTRTRVSFEAGIGQLGGHALYLSPNDTQLGRGEPLEDTARVLSQMVNLVMIRTFSHESLERYCSASSIPVINGLTDLVHPCQLLADMQTYFTYRGDIKGKTVAWVGDGNNVCNSFINTAKLLDFNLRIASPAGYGPDKDLLAKAGANIHLCNTPNEAVDGADLVVTDVWASMGQESEANKRTVAFADYRVTKAHMALADKDALFMHCLPAHRGEEVDADVIDGEQSVIWDEAGNRLHAQKALMEFLLNQASN
ncbi:UNVERIFIED_CONTAM: hypothetical protein GTU68_008039 [Idotea baltica]|nr:hypothetical protein [Idotea baltica]